MTGEGLRASSLDVEIGAWVILKDVNLAVSSGQMAVVTGPSGSGKSTLLRVLAGLRISDHGEVTIDGTPLDQTDPSKLPAFVPQDFGLVSGLTASETIGLPLQVHGNEKAVIRERTLHWLGSMGLEACGDRVVEELSGGQRQRVAIARALAQHSAIVVMDEPTAELDPANRELVLSMLKSQLEQGVTLVVVSHETDVLAGADLHLQIPALRTSMSA